MKKLIYIVFGVLLFTAISCEKEVIQPNNTIENQSNNTINRDKDFGANNNSEDEKSNPVVPPYTTTSTTSFQDSSNVITDPNRDEDDIKKDKSN